MEWGKIKTMFIYLFLVLNIVLASIYGYVVYKNQTELYQEKDEIVKSIQNEKIEIIEPLIKKDSLGYVNATIKSLAVPKEIKDNISYELETDNGIESLIVTLEKPITNINEKSYRDLLSNYSLTQIDKNAQFYFEGYDEKNKVIIFRQVIDGLVIYDNENATLKFYVDGNGDIKKYSYSILDSFQFEKTETIISHTQAVYSLYHNNLVPSNSRVTSVLGYYTRISKLSNQVLIPVWKIEVTHELSTETYYIDAINNKVLEQS